MPAAKSPIERIFARLWRRPAFRRIFYNAISMFSGRQHGWRMMNCGWMPPNGELPPGDEALNRALYLRMTDGIELGGRDVLEAGSGRGGGCIFLHEHFAPARMAGLDFAGASVRWCRRHFARPGLEFHRGDAVQLPFPASSFDVVCAVELTHCVPDKSRFLAGAARVLRPGGDLLVADFFYSRPDAGHSLARFRDAIAGSAFTVSVDEDLTPGVVAALEADAGRRDEIIRSRVPRLFRPAAAYFGGGLGGSTYLGLVSGKAVYRRFVLRRGT